MSAPMGCSVCRLPPPTVAEIDAALVQKGVSRSAVARQYGIGRESLRRHKQNHLAGRLRAAAKASQAEPADALLERLRENYIQVRELSRQAGALLEKALAANELGEARMCIETALKASARADQQIVLEGRLLGIGELAPAGGNTVNVFAIDAETGLRIAQVYVQRHGTPAPALSPAPIESEALEPADAATEPIQESA